MEPPATASPAGQVAPRHRAADPAQQSSRSLPAPAADAGAGIRPQPGAPAVRSGRAWSAFPPERDARRELRLSAPDLQWQLTVLAAGGFSPRLFRPVRRAPVGAPAGRAAHPA